MAVIAVRCCDPATFWRHSVASCNIHNTAIPPFPHTAISSPSGAARTERLGDISDAARPPARETNAYTDDERAFRRALFTPG